MQAIHSKTTCSLIKLCGMSSSVIMLMEKLRPEGHDRTLFLPSTHLHPLFLCFKHGSAFLFPPVIHLWCIVVVGCSMGCWLVARLVGLFALFCCPCLLDCGDDFAAADHRVATVVWGWVRVKETDGPLLPLSLLSLLLWLTCNIPLLWWYVCDIWGFTCIDGQNVGLWSDWY